jgi:hypothetical protein
MVMGFRLALFIGAVLLFAYVVFLTPLVPPP